MTFHVPRDVFAAPAYKPYRPAPAAGAGDILGAGATFPYPIYAKWADAYKNAPATDPLSVDRSGGSIKQIKANTVTFGTSDLPLKPEDLKAPVSFSFRR